MVDSFLLDFFSTKFLFQQNIFWRDHRWFIIIHCKFTKYHYCGIIFLLSIPLSLTGQKCILVKIWIAYLSSIYVFIVILILKHPVLSEKRFHVINSIDVYCYKIHAIKWQNQLDFRYWKYLWIRDANNVITNQFRINRKYSIFHILMIGMRKHNMVGKFEIWIIVGHRLNLKQWKVFAPIDISNSQNITLIQHKHYAFCKDITYVGNTLIQLMLILVYLLDEYFNTPFIYNILQREVHLTNFLH